MTTTLIRVGTLLDGTGQPALRDALVRIEEGRITAAGPATDLRIRESVTVHAPDATLTPGLIDAHVHLAWGLDVQPTWPNYADTSDGRFAWALAGAQAALSAGVTTQRDCGAPDLVTVRLRDIIETGLLTGPRVVACGPCITTTAGHGEFIGVTADSVEQVRTRVRELCRGGVDGIKVMASGGDMDPHTNRYRPQFTDVEMQALVADAHRLGLPVVAHCNATSSIRQAVEAGVDTIAHCNWLAETPGKIDYDPAVAAAILSNGIAIDLNVAATIRAYSDGDGWAMSTEFAHRNRWEVHEDLRAAGARLFFTSDEFGARTSLFPQLLTRTVHELGIDVSEVVHRATHVPAEALGLSDVGSISAGAIADLALFDGDLTLDATVLTRPLAVWRAGERVVHNGTLTIPRSDT